MSSHNLDKDLVDKRLQQIVCEDDDLRHQNKFKDSYQSLSGVLTKFQLDHSNINSASVSPNESNENVKELSVNTSFRTINSRLQLQDALPTDEHTDTLPNSRAVSTNFYIDSNLKESDIENEDEQFHPQPC